MISYRFHKFVLALCVTACLAVSMWPSELSIGVMPEPTFAPGVELNATLEAQWGPPTAESSNTLSPGGRLIERAAAVGP